MAKNLVIVESPSKAGTIKKILGKSYEVLASNGHLRDLPKTKIGVNVEENFEPSYTTVKGKADVIKKLKAAAKKVDNVYLASDPDREGEAIAWHIGQILKIDFSEKNRIEFNEITTTAVKNAIKNRRTVDMNRVDAQQTRRILDRLVGYKISPLLWQTIGQNTSAGRVQSVALKIICDLEDIIQAFVPEVYYDVNAEFENAILLKLHKIKGKKVDRIFDKAVLDRLEATIPNKVFNLISQKVSAKKKRPPLPLKTSTLQQLASSYLGFSVTKTMRVAQSLYEGVTLSEGQMGLITYMRTDSQRISKDAILEAKEFIENTYGKEYVGNYVNPKVKGNVQDAHEAIRPSDISKIPDNIAPYLNSDQYKLYKLIWERFMISQLANMEYQQQEIITEYEQYQFRGIINKITFDGYYKVFKEDIETHELLDFGDKNQLTLEKILSKEGITKAPARLSEATLVKQLEAEGIGRPSTYAAIVSTLKDREYVEVDKRSFVPTPLGMEVKKEMEMHFPRIMNIKFTALMEDELDSIAEGKLVWQEALREFYESLEASVQAYGKDIETIKEQGIATDLLCPNCSKPLKMKTGRFGKFLECSDYPECKTRIKIPKVALIPLGDVNEKMILSDKLDMKKITAPAIVKKTDVPCRQCETLMEYKIGRFGPYIQCPECKATLSILKRYVFDAEAENIIINAEIVKKETEDKALIEAAGKCEKCGSDFLVKNGRFGPFLACSNFPKCKNIKRDKKKKETE